MESAKIIKLMMGICKKPGNGDVIAAEIKGITELVYNRWAEAGSKDKKSIESDVGTFIRESSSEDGVLTAAVNCLKEADKVGAAHKLIEAIGTLGSAVGASGYETSDDWPQRYMDKIFSFAQKDLHLSKDDVLLVDNENESHYTNPSLRGSDVDASFIESSAAGSLADVPAELAA